MVAFNFPSWGASNAPTPGAPTPSATANPLVLAVALGMLASAYLGAVVVMVVSYVNNSNATLPTAIGAILFMGLGFVTHALGNAQGATTAQSAANTGAAIQQSGQATGAATTAVATSAANSAQAGAGVGASAGGGAV